MNLLHPIIRVRIPLPDPRILLADDPDCGSELRYFYENFIQKTLLSGRSNSTGDGNFTVSVIYGNRSRLAFWRSAGDFTWTKIVRSSGYFADLINYKVKLFAIHYHGDNIHLWAVDMEDHNGQDPTLIILDKFAFDWIIDKMYLVECCSELLVVVRQGVQSRDKEEVEWESEEDEGIDFYKTLQFCTYGTIYFMVFKLNLNLNLNSRCSSINESQWEVIHDMGRSALFLGHSSSFCIDIDASNESIKPNSIYFTDDARVTYLSLPDYKGVGGGKDLGIYSLEDKTIVPHFEGESYSRLTPPIWIQPSL